MFVGVRRTWKRLIDGDCGIVSIKDRSTEFALLPSQVAALVPTGSKDHGLWNPKEYLSPGVRLGFCDGPTTAKKCRMSVAWPVLLNMR